MNKRGEMGMKKIVPFKKEITFQTNVSEITSISLEHNLHLSDNNLITGNFNISGEYKIADTSVSTEIFNFELPFDINVDEKYDLANLVVDIDDFYYEIVNNKILEVNIDVLLDKLVEKPLIEKEEIIKSDENIDVSDVMNSENIMDESDSDIMERCIEKEDILSELEKENDKLIEQNKTNDNRPAEIISEETEVKETKSIQKINSLFDNLDSSSETYKTYKICIIRNGDTIESVMQKYSITKEELEKYNNISEVKIGDKLIIPSINDEKV